MTPPPSIGIGIGVDRAAPSLSSWSPLELSPYGWWNSQNVTTSGSDITAATDLSGNGRNLSAGASSPELVASQINGYPSMLFAGTDSLNVAGVSLPNPKHVFAVGACNDLAFAAIVDSSAQPATRMTIGRKASDDEWAIGAASSISSGITVDTNWHYITGLWKTNFGELRIDGVAGTSGNPGNHTPTAFRVGSTQNASNPFGDVAEVILFAEELSSTNRDLVEAWLKAKYAL